MRNLSEMKAIPGLLSLSGHPVTGRELVRHIYSDEAGVSAKETVSVVTSLLVHGDTQWGPIYGRMFQLADEHVPKEYRPEFALHTKNLFDKDKYPNWDRPKRYIYLREVLRIPEQAGIPICVGAVRRGTQTYPPMGNLSPEKIDHSIAFMLSISKADKLIRNKCGTEMATLVAEDHPEMKRVLRTVINVMRTNPLSLPGTFNSTDQNVQDEPHRVERIIDEVHFSDRLGSPLLQIADACAFAIRRYLCNLSYGDSYMDDILGPGRTHRPEEKAQWPHFSCAYYNCRPDGRLFNLFDPSQAAGASQSS